MFARGPRVLSSAAARQVAASADPYARQFARLPFAPAEPSSRIKLSVSHHARDRHGMPVYSPAERTRYVRTTAYACSECDHLQYGVLNAAGTSLRFDHRVRSAAADWSVYPVGTVFKVKGLPYLYVVDDYGSALVGTQTIDMFMPNEAWMRAWGRRNVEITVVKWGSFRHSAELLAKRVHHPHCRQMYASIVRRSTRG
jgi:3D (Asp-Asp-Asp) domain-containing protein